MNLEMLIFLFDKLDSLIKLGFFLKHDVHQLAKSDSDREGSSFGLP